VKAAGTAKAFYRALKEKRTIEKLQRRLEERSAALDSAILFDLHGKTDRNTVEQRQGVDDVQKGLESIHNGLQINAQDHAAQVATASGSLGNGIRGVLTQLESETAARKNDLALQAESEQRARSQDAFLKSLVFEDMTKRQESVSAPSHDTFRWVFETDSSLEQRDDKRDDKRVEASQSYDRWLREGLLFWVNGR